MSNYNPSSQNDLSFNCDYNAPTGEVNLIFPDSPCSAFDFFDATTGENVNFAITQTDEWLLYGYAGENVEIPVLTFRILDLDEIPTGEEFSLSTIYISQLIESDGVSGELLEIDSLELPSRAELLIENYTDELLEFELSASYSFDLFAYAGEINNVSFELLNYSSYILSEGPSAYWKFDEQTGTAVIDATGNNSNSLLNQPTIGHSSPIASHFSFYFDGINDFVSGPPLSLASANLTQELWVKPDADATITLVTPASSGVQGNTGQRYAVYPYQNGSGSGGGLSIGANGIQVVAYGDSYFPVLLSYQQHISTTEFTHVLVSWNDRTPTLYVNGVAVATGYQARSPFASQGLPSNGQFGYYKGYMQDVVIYNSALTSEQAREHYLAGLGLHYIPRFEPLISYNGEYANTDFTIDTSTLGVIGNLDTGEVAQIGIENNVCFYSDALSGEYNYINDNFIDVISNITHWHGTSPHSQTSTCLSLYSNGTAGINAYFALPFQLENDSNIIFYFKRTQSIWHDDDFSDAGLWFCFLPNIAPDSIDSIVSFTTYDRPILNSSIKGSIFVKLRNSNNGAIQVSFVHPTSGNSYNYNLTVLSSWTTTELDGTDECSIVIKPSSANTIVEMRGINNIVRQTGTFTVLANPFANGFTETTDTFLIHYHNYSNPTIPEILCGMRIGTQEGFVFVLNVFLGYNDAYSGETSLINELYTSSIFDSDAYAGELLDWTFSPSPSFDLGILSNLAGENVDSILLTASIIQIDSYTGENTINDIVISLSEGMGIFNAYSGERNDAGLIGFSVFRDLDATEGQTAFFDLSVYPPAILISDAYAGEDVFFDISVELAIEIIGYSGENALFTFNTSPAIDLETLDFYGGYCAESELTTSSVFALSFYAGSTEEVLFTPAPRLELDLSFYAGSNGVGSLASVALLEAKIYADENIFSSLDTFIGTTFTPIFYPGATASVLVSTTDKLSAIVYTGQYALSSIFDSPSVPLNPEGYSGEQVNVEILPGITFPSNAYDGASGSFDLDYIVNEGLPAGWYNGESVEFNLATTDALSFVGTTGEIVNVYFGASFALYSDAYSGAYAVADLTLNLFDQISSDAYSGQIITPSLSTTTKLPNISFAGETLLFELNQSLQPNLLIMAYNGQNVISDIQIAFQLPVGRAYSGTVVVVNQIDSEPNILFYTGTHFNASLSTSDVFKLPSIETGENCFTVLQVGKSEELGTFRVYPGTELLSTFDTIHHANLYVMFRTSIMTQVDMGSTTHFDLSTDDCCGVRKETLSNNLMMQLFIKDYLPEARSEGNRVDYSLELRCAPRFSIEFATGNSMYLSEYNNYISMDFSTGAEGIFDGFDADLDHRLCKGHFIPNGNWLVVEMQDILQEECYIDVFYAGTTMNCVLSDDIVLRIDTNGDGGSLHTDLTIFPPWIFKAYSGEEMLFESYTQYAIYPKAYPGELLQCSLYDEPYLGYCGESGVCDLTIEYHVRFKETGCLDNDFTFQNDHGDLIAELANSVPVEGEPFYHSVIAECL